MGETGVSKTIVKGLQVLELLGERPQGMTLAEISQLAELPKPTALRVLRTLTDGHMVRTDGDERYRLGAQCLVLGTAFLETLDLRDEAKGVLEELSERTEETCHLGVMDGTRVVYIEKVESPRSVRMYSRVGLTNPLHSAALGKAMLAFSPPEVVEKVLAGPLERRTQHTTVDRDGLREELARIRRRGYAIDDVENEEGIRCVAAPVFDHEGDVAAGMSVSGPKYRLSLETLETFSGYVTDAAEQLSARLGSSEHLRLVADR